MIFSFGVFFVFPFRSDHLKGVRECSTGSKPTSARIVPAFLGSSSDLIKGVRVHVIRVVACRKNGFPNRSFFLVACFMGERCKFVDLAF